MKKSFIYILVFVQCMLLVTDDVNAQHSDLDLARYKDRYRLSIEIDSSDNVKKYYSTDCSSEPVTHLPDNQKMKLIEKLLGYERDTSWCTDPVYRLHPLSTQTREPVSKKYRIQTKALVLINLLAFGSDFFLYSPYPVLCFVDSDKELTNNQKKMSQVYAIYRKWFNELKAKGFKSFGHPPLEEVGIKWFNSAFPNRIYASWGAWDSSFNCVEFE